MDRAKHIYHLIILRGGGGGLRTNELLFIYLTKFISSLIKFRLRLFSQQMNKLSWIFNEKWYTVVAGRGLIKKT